MSKFDPGNLLWFGAAPVPPEPSPYLLGWNPALRKFKPYGLPVKKLAETRTASSEFVARTKSMMDNVSPGIQAALIKYGLAVLPVSTVFDALHFTWLNWGGPRGHDGRFSWKTISGLAMYDGHLLLICEFHEEERGLVRHYNPQGLFNHELGHCLDEALKMISSSPEFLACVAADIKNLSPSDKATYRYLLQPDLAGPSELFAECLACTQGQCCVESWTKAIPKCFSNSHQFVKDLVGRLSATPFQQETSNVL